MNRGRHLYSAGRPSRWALAHILVVIVMETVCRELRVLLYRGSCMLMTEVVIAETEEDLIKRLNEWKDNMENRCMR